MRVNMLQQHHELCPHHRYQLEVIFLFVFGFFLLFPYYLLIEELGLETELWQWAFSAPWILFYSWYSLATRDKIPKSERRRPMKRPIGHWILLGLALLLLHLQPTNLKNLYSFDLMFAAFTLFLADSYWDFIDS